MAGLHTPDEDRAFFNAVVFETCETWGAFSIAGLMGFIAFRDGWIDQFYVLPGGQRSGIGSALLRIAQSRFATLSLWTFQRNAGGRAFYEARGFEAAEFTDGSGNEEREPDVRFEWRDRRRAVGSGRIRVPPPPTFRPAASVVDDSPI